MYDELRRLAAQRLAHEKPGQTLQATALVHEAYLRLVAGIPIGEPTWHQIMRWETRRAFHRRRGRSHDGGFSLGKAHRKQSDCGTPGNREREPLEDNEPAILPSVDPVDLLALDRSTRSPRIRRPPRRARVVKLRYFAGLTLPDVARMLGISQSTAEADWTYAKAWLKREMEKS